MSTHNIGFYEDLTKIIFELSSNIINYAPYFFCCEPAKQGRHWLDYNILWPLSPSAVDSGTAVFSK